LTEPVLLRNVRLAVTPRGPLERVDVLVEEGVVSEIGEGLDKGGLVLDCSRAAVVPGLSNACVRLEALFLRGAAIEDAPERIGRELAYVSSLLGLYEMASAGIACFADTSRRYGEVAKAASEIRLRGALAPPVSDGKSAAEVLQRLESELASLPLEKAVSLESTLVPDEELAEVLERAADRGAKVLARASASRREVFESKRRYGLFPVERLERLGLLSELVILLEVNWITSWEIEYVARRKSGVVYAPSSAMESGSDGFLPLVDMVEKGIAVALGTPNPRGPLDVLGEARLALLLQKSGYQREEISPALLFDCATRGGYEVMGVAGGLLEEGAPADLVVLDLASPGMPAALRDFTSALVSLAPRGCVRATLVSGDLVYRREDDELRAAMEELVDRLRELVTELEQRA